MDTVHIHSGQLSLADIPTLAASTVGIAVLGVTTHQDPPTVLRALADAIPHLLFLRV